MQPSSAHMLTPAVFQMTPMGEEVFRVATDGGCRDTTGGPRAGWGAFSDCPHLCLSGPVCGQWQTAQRAEVMAVAQVLSQAAGRVHILTDSRYVADRLRLFLDTRVIGQGQHADLWSVIFGHSVRLAGVTWIKAHLTLEEALGRGYTADDWRLNEGADAAATRGVAMHHEDPGALVLFQYRVARVVLWQTYLLRLYIRYRSLPKFVGAVLPGLHPRSRPQGAPNLPRTVRTDLRWKARHAITTHPKEMPVFTVVAPPAPHDVTAVGNEETWMRARHGAPILLRQIPYNTHDG